MSICVVSDEIFDAFLKCESKAYFKSSGQIFSMRGKAPPFFDARCSSEASVSVRDDFSPGYEI